jgi:putative ABC transport system permease protein
MRTIYRLLLRLYPARFREEYGGPLERQFEDDYREVRGLGARLLFWLRALADLGTSIPAEFAREMRQDLSYAARIYRRRKFVTGLAVLALAIAIGAATGVFSVVNAVLLRSLPFRDPAAIVELQTMPYRYGDGAAAFHNWRTSIPYLEDAAEFESHEMTLGLAGSAVRVRTIETSANFFQLMGSDLEIGRSFAPGEDSTGRDAVAVIGHDLWQQAFGSDPRVLGATIRLNGTPLTVIGVAAAVFDFPNHTAVWTPTAFDPELLPKTGAWMIERIGRLKNGVTLTQARSLFEADVRRLTPDALKDPGRMRPALIPLRDELAGPVGRASLALLGLVGFVVLIACANVAHLLLSRAAERRQEMALRTALGASRARLVQQLVTESILLTLIASAAGLAVAKWASSLISLVQPASLANQAYTVLDWRVLGFSIAIALLTGVLFGAIPVSLIGRISSSALRAGSPSRFRAALIALQTALTVVLLTGSFTVGRGFVRMLGTDLGYRTADVVTAAVSLTPRENSLSYPDEALGRLRAITGVEAAGATAYLPLTSGMLSGLGGGYVAVGDRFRSGPNDREVLAAVIRVSPDYFRAIGTSVLSGREFLSADRRESPPVAIVNEAYLRACCSGQLVGRHLTSTFHKQPMAVVGVVRDGRYGGPATNAGPQVFVPEAQWSPANSITFVVRVKGRAAAYLPIVRDALRSIDSNVPVYNVKTLDDWLRENLVRPRFYTTVVLFLGIFALLLSATGVYGAAAFSIEQRTHEIGVRLAIGATPIRLRGMLLGQSLLPLAAGTATGLAGAAGIGSLIGHIMASAEPAGVAATGASAGLLAVIAALAVWRAGRRVAQLDPMQVLRAN